jgi:hypothetical protein
MDQERQEEVEDPTIYNAYGDASTGETGTFYGFLLLPEDAEEAALQMLSNVKEKFGGSSDSRLHCREMFRWDARAKSEWAHLSAEQATELCSLALNGLHDLGVKFAMGIMPVEHYPKSFRLKGKNGHPDLVHDVDDKWRELWAFQRAAMMLDPVEQIEPADPKIVPSPLNQPWWQVIAPLAPPGFKVRKVYLDRESTKIRWFSKKFQWTTLAKDFVIKGTLGESFLPIQDGQADSKHPMLDLADIFVWNVARSTGSNPMTLLDRPARVHAVGCANFGEELVFGD